MSPSFFEYLAEALEPVIWGLPCPQLESADPALRQLVAAAGGSLFDVLAQLSDETLAVAVQKNFWRKHAFEELLVNRYEKPLLQWLRTHSGSWETAQDLLQSVYVKLLAHNVLGSYLPAQPFEAWLWTVVRNAWVSEWRRARRRAALPGIEQEGREPRPPDEAIARELEQRVEAVVGQLPDPQPAIFREAMRGADAEQIGRALGLPRQTVYRLLFKARRQIRQTLGRILRPQPRLPQDGGRPPNSPERTAME